VVDQDQRVGFGHPGIAIANGTASCSVTVAGLTNAATQVNASCAANPAAFRAGTSPCSRSLQRGRPHEALQTGVDETDGGASRHGRFRQHPAGQHEGATISNLVDPEANQVDLAHVTGVRWWPTAITA
jgi:hypothetical protein